MFSLFLLPTHPNILHKSPKALCYFKTVRVLQDLSSPRPDITNGLSVIVKKPKEQTLGYLLGLQSHLPQAQLEIRQPLSKG